MEILGVSGSLRAGSFNARLLSAAAGLLPGGMGLRVVDWGDLPHYNADLDGEVKPASVQRWLDAVSGCDALLFATPEYNHSIPGGLKNATDWASRPAYRSLMAGKPAGILSASISPVGGARVQAHLRKVLNSTLSPVYPAPDLLIGSAADRFDAEGRFADAESLGRLKRYLEDFAVWVRLQTGRTLGSAA